MDNASLLAAVREKQPLVHHLTNWVTIYDCAQLVKSFGASPVMAHAVEEAADMASLASALVLNIGTLTTELIEGMKLAARAANAKGAPVVLDVCGAGATPFRDRMVAALLDAARIDIIKGNASEIARVAGRQVRTRGVDAGSVEGNLAGIAETLAAASDCVVVVTGKEDIVAGKGARYFIKNGHEMMSRVVGTGCMAASAIGAFAGVCPEDLPRAATAGLVCFEVAAELAVKGAQGPGSFKERLFDSVAGLTGENVSTMQKVW
ncbi:MAG TPA: hydroxyethylthiazole kinase [Spirochaetota bacterium]|nr:hydroxyethylthiazole kinase [Spirochaetota bacterium]